MVSLLADVGVGSHYVGLSNSNIPRTSRVNALLIGGRQKSVGERVWRKLVRCASSIPGEAFKSELQKKPSFPSSVSKSEFIKFYGASDIRTAELSTVNGSTCRVLIDEARVTSYEAMMWHGAVEELLYCEPNETVDDGDLLIRGGITMSFPRSDGLLAGFPSHPHAELAARCRWEVESASSSNMGKKTEVVLVTSISVDAHDASSLEGSTWAGSFTLRASFVLTGSSLSISLSARNDALSPSQVPTLSSLHSSWTDGREAGCKPGEQQQTASPFVVAPSICAHLGVSTIKGVKLLGLKNSRFIDFEPAKADARGLLEGWFGGLLSQVFQPPATSEASPVSAKAATSKDGAMLGTTALSSSSNISVESSQASLEQAEKSESAPLTSSSEAIEQGVAGTWAFDEGGGSGRLMQEQADYAEVVAPLRRIAWDDVRAVTMLDRGRRLSTTLQGTKGTHILTMNPGEKSRSDCDSFLIIGCTMSTNPLDLGSGKSCDMGLTIYNRGAP